MNDLSPPARVALAKDALATAYRTTFQEYSRKLQALQTLMDSSAPGHGPLDARLLDATLLEVEKARVAHSCARNQLARELLRSPALVVSRQAPVANDNEGHIRKTAQLLWEMAGRPEGTADGDWTRAERLVQAAAAGAC